MTNGILIIDQAAGTEDRRMRQIARYQPKHCRSRQGKTDESDLLRSSLSDLLNVPDGCPPDCEVVEYALLSLQELAERLVTLGPAGANAVGTWADTTIDLIARRRRDDEIDL